METVFGLIQNNRLRAIHYLGAYLLAAMGGHTVHHNCRWFRFGQQGAVDLKGFEDSQTFGNFLFLPATTMPLLPACMTML